MKAILIETGETYTLELTTESSASSYGIPVAVVSDGPDEELLGQALGTFDVAVLWELEPNSDAEVAEWTLAGYV